MHVCIYLYLCALLLLLSYISLDLVVNMSKESTTSLNTASTSQSTAPREFFSGFIAGSITSVVVHPFDLVKLRLQLNATNGIQQSWITITKGLWKDQNRFWLSTLYRGVAINALGNSIAWALYFGIYRSFKDQLISITDDVPSISLPWVYLTSGTLAGITTSVLTNPIWVLKTRIMAQNKSLNGNVGYDNIISSIRKIKKDHGWGIWKIGIVPSILSVSQGALYFMVYDTLKSYRFTKLKKQKLDTLEILSFTSISKMISMSLVYPLQLLKSNQQSLNATNCEEYRYIRHLIPLIIKQNGVSGLYKGLFTNLSKSIPSTCLTFYIYETVNNL